MMIRTYRDALLGQRDRSYTQSLMLGLGGQLSAAARPFHPIMGEDTNGVIYNDGIPTLQLRSSGRDFLKSFTDDTLDEAFPPTAEDAAELEVCERFVEILAYLDLLERKEEATRLVHAGLKKRWESRRELIGRPKKGTRNVVKKSIHGGSKLHMKNDLVIYDHSNTVLEHRMRGRQRTRMQKARVQKKQRAFMKAARLRKQSIIQPRKQN